MYGTTCNRRLDSRRFAATSRRAGASSAWRVAIRFPPLDTKPLDTAGMSYDTIQQLKALNVTRRKSLSSPRRGRADFPTPAASPWPASTTAATRPFDAGDDIAGLARAQVAEDTIIELAKLNQLGLASGEFQAMRLAGLSDAIVLEVARHRAAGQAGARRRVSRQPEKRRRARTHAARACAPRSSRFAGGCDSGVSPPRRERRANHQPLRSALARPIFRLSPSIAAPVESSCLESRLIALALSRLLSSCSRCAPRLAPCLLRRATAS